MFFFSVLESQCVLKNITDNHYQMHDYLNSSFLQILIFPAMGGGGFPVVLSTLLIPALELLEIRNRKMSVVKVLSAKPEHLL